jgi:TrmH family RNA methyltransferase
MGARMQRCSAEVMAALSSLSHASRAVGVFRANDLPPLAAGSPASQVGLQLHGVSDPGNLGTLLRSAQGFGPAHVALAEGCADPLSPRSVRASMGALYSVPVIILREAPALPLIALDARGGQTLAELAPVAPVAFALGGERTGLPAAVTAAADSVARIPLADGAESLNVAIVGALALYELRRAP